MEAVRRLGFLVRDWDNVITYNTSSTLGQLPEALFPMGHMNKAGDPANGVVLWEGLSKAKMTKTGTDLNRSARFSY